MDVCFEGKGAGKLQIVAESGSLQSEPYTLLDTLKYDTGVQGTANDGMWNNNVSRFSRGAEYTTFTHTSSVTTYTSISGDICIELDVCGDTNYANSNLLSIRGSGDVLLNASRSQLQIPSDAFNHIKIEISSNQCIITNTDKNQSVTGSVTGFDAFYLRIGSNETIYFKNVKVYPI